MMNITNCLQFIIFLLFCSIHYPTLCPAIQHSCPHDQSHLLLEFKSELNVSFSIPDDSYYRYDDDYYCPDKTKYWNKSTDCCNWEGVGCDKITSQVIGLDLSCALLYGTIGANSSLYHLSHLQRLNLGHNHILIPQVSKIFGNLTHLTHLNLSGLQLGGEVPSEILKLTKLVSLDLSLSGFTVEPNIFKLLLTNFTKLSQISLSHLNILSSIPKNLSSSLEVVELGDNKLQGEVPQNIFHPPNLRTLVLSGNSKLYGLLPSVRWNSSSTLERLDLSWTSFSGEIPDSIRNLKALRFLDFSYCGFNGSLPEGIFNHMTQIEEIYLSGNRLIGSLPTFPREMKHLTWLSLYNNSFTGTIMPSWPLSLSSLEYLDLRFNSLYGPLPLEFSSLVNLKDLYLSLNNFSGNVDLEVFSKMKQLQALSLSHNRLSLLTKSNSTLPETISYLDLASCNITDLKFLRGPSSHEIVDLSMNKIREVPSWLWPMWEKVHYLNLSYNAITHTGEIALPYISILDLRSNMFHGPFPQVSNVQCLLISDNNFFGMIPSSIICSLSMLALLDISNNNFTGSIPQCIGNMSPYLSVLDLRMNKLEGTIPTDISSEYLTTLNLHGNHLQGSIPSSLAECTDLTVLDLGNNHLNGSFPSWLGTLKKLRVLSLRSNNLHGKISFSPTSFSRLQILDLSHNQFTGTLSLNLFKSFTSMMESGEIGKSPSYFGNRSAYYEDSTMVVNKGVELELVRILKTQGTLIDLRSNMFHGPFPQVPNVQYLLISNNNFSGVIPPSIICSLDLKMLDLSNNSFTGCIPHIIGTVSPNLQVLDMRMNKLEGTIPTYISSVSLTTLNLHGNHLRGSIPSSLAKCTNLTVLDLGNNHLNGSFPSWLGNLQKLRVLSLRSNNLHGKISFSPTSFSRLQILDLSHNQFTGTLSLNLFKSFTSMMESGEIGESPSYIGNRNAYYEDSTMVVNKGVEVELVRILTTWDTIDLSSNNFEGKIPSSVGGLLSLRQLNFSNNKFASEISISFGNLSVLESLDLSSNQLIGAIPTQLATLNFLSMLNLSHNHLTGRIPSTAHFQTFGNDSYIDNDGLCGFPLSGNCEGDSPDLSHSQEEEDDSGFIDGFNWRSVVIGYGVGMVLGLGISCLMMITRKPKWLSIIV